jgi:hypothetical protein
MIVPPYVVGATDAAIPGNLDAGKAAAESHQEAKAASVVVGRKRVARGALPIAWLSAS